MGLSMSLTKFAITVCISLLASSAWACSCRDKNVGEVAHSKDIVLTKLRINYPSLTERLFSFFERPTNAKSYSITVLEDVKGKFTASNITASTFDGETDCSRRVKYGETLFVIAHKNSEGYTSNDVNFCNTTTENFAHSVKNEHANPSYAYKSVEPSDWTQLLKTDTQSFYADTKNVTKDEYGSYIWVLMNDSDLMYKSRKYQIKIACKEKMFLASQGSLFSEPNANGSLVRFSFNYLMDSSKWLPLTDLYSKLVKYTC
jgi:hypothetical protein